jgi:hypothetical protein
MTSPELAKEEPLPKRIDYRDARRGGFYWLEGQPFASVTTIIGVLDKPALRYWFGKQVYLATVANPGMSEKEAMNAPYSINNSAKDRGQTIHSIVEAFKATGDYIEGIPAEFRGYAQAFYKWTQDNHAAIIDHERTVVSRKHGFAGTLDLLVTLNGSDKKVVVDVKTGKDIYMEAYLQLAAYRQALKEEGTEVAGVAVLLLQENGSYKYEYQETNMFREFFACKVLWEWLNAEDIAKVTAYARKEQHGKAVA